MDKNEIFLAQTDTTVGFLSQNSDKLKNLKNRDINKPFLKIVDSFFTLKKFVRPPNRFKNKIRRSKKTTFIYSNNQAIRVNFNLEHNKLLQKFKWFYSTSANEKSKKYDSYFAYQNATVVCEDNRGLFETSSSKIIKLSQNKEVRLRWIKYYLWF